MTTVDPRTGQHLPPNAIQRVLFLCSAVHVYQIPPLRSTKGHCAAEWTANNNGRQIFSGRLRIIETSYPSPSPLSSVPKETTETTNHSRDRDDHGSADKVVSSGNNDDDPSIQTDIVLEDLSSSQLFAAAPYTHRNTILQCFDSSRFFAMRVVGDDGGGRGQVEAWLGIGFEERGDAFEFCVVLQDVRRIMGWQGGDEGGGDERNRTLGQRTVAQQRHLPSRNTSSITTNAAVVNPTNSTSTSEKLDFSLKAGETITVKIGGRGRRNRQVGSGMMAMPDSSTNAVSQEKGGAGIIAIPPPPPPPVARRRVGHNTEENRSSGQDGECQEHQPHSSSLSSLEHEAEQQSSRQLEPEQVMQISQSPLRQQSKLSNFATSAMGFDDGEFGEFE